MDPWVSCRLMGSPTGFVSVGNDLRLLCSFVVVVVVFFVFFFLLLLPPVTEYWHSLDGASTEDSLVSEGKRCQGLQHPASKDVSNHSLHQQISVDERNAGKNAWRAYNRSKKAYETVLWWCCFGGV